MIGIVNHEKLEKDFLNIVYQKTDQGFCETVKDIEVQKEKILETMKCSWSKCFEKLGDKYQKLQDSRVTGELCYGYLSFLRSGILDQTDWYRMDYYDARGYVSEIECGEMLEVTHILKRFNQYIDDIRALFASQTRVKAYVADRIIYQMAENFAVELEPLLLEAFNQVLVEEGKELYGKHTVQFFIGEFFAQVKPMSVWSDSKMNHLEYGF